MTNANSVGILVDDVEEFLLIGGAIETTALAICGKRECRQTMYIGRSSDRERPRKVPRVSRRALALIE